MNIPCINCLVLASCISRLKKHKNIYGNNIYFLIISALCPICDNLDSFIHLNNYYNYVVEHRENIVTFFSEKTGIK